MEEEKKGPIVLCVVDGFGLTSSWRGNAIFSAAPKNFFQLWSSYPHSLLASVKDAEAKQPEYDNPERYLGSLFQGSTVKSEREFVDDQIQNKLLSSNNNLNNALIQSIERNSSLHLIGNLSGESGKYSELKHLFALLSQAKEKNIFRVYIHLILDDTGGGYEPMLDSLHALEGEIARVGVGEIASVSGLNYILEKTSKSYFDFQKAYKAIIEGSGASYLSAEQAINKNKKTASSPSDISPSVISFQNNPIGIISDFDSIIFFNHNNCKLNKLIYALSSNGMESSSLRSVKFLYITTFFSCILPKPEQVRVIFEREININIPSILYQSGLSQAYISDSTRMLAIKSELKGLEDVNNVYEYFVPILNQNQYLDNTDKIISEIFLRTIDTIKQQKYDFIFIDIPCIDEVATNGTFDQTIKAIKSIDGCLPSLLKSVFEAEGKLIFTSTYGNAERMALRNKYEVLNSRTIDPTPFVFATKENFKRTVSANVASGLVYDMMLKKNNLTDVAPTILELFNLPVPKEFTGASLVNVKKVL
jgi:2,3-bisphosphoglycerate-independent phosphoglycerate mutase